MRRKLATAMDRLLDEARLDPRRRRHSQQGPRLPKLQRANSRKGGGGTSQHVPFPSFIV